MKTFVIVHKLTHAKGHCRTTIEALDPETARQRWFDLMHREIYGSEDLVPEASRKWRIDRLFVRMETEDAAV